MAGEAVKILEHLKEELTMNLKQFRKEHNLKLRDMQQILEMKNISQYQNLEKDNDEGKTLSIKNALKISEHFKISLDDIYGITKEEQEAGITTTMTIPVTVQEDELLMLFRDIGERIGEGGQRAIIQLCENLLENIT